MLVFVEAVVEQARDAFFVEVLADEDDFLHTVAVFVVPVVSQAGVAAHHLDEFVFGHGGKPESGFVEFDLHAGLFEEVRHVFVVREIADALCSDYVARPVEVDEAVEFLHVESFASIVDKGADAIFLHFAAFVMMVVVVMMSVLVLVVVVMLVLIFLVVMMFVLFILVLIVVMMVMFVLVLLMVVVSSYGL